MKRFLSQAWLNRLVSLTIIFLATSPSKSYAGIIEDTCKATKYYDLCVSTLRADPRSSTADAKGLAGVALNALLIKANSTFNHALDLFKRAGGDPVLYRLYGTCVDVYGGSVTRLLPEAVGALSSNQYSTAREDAEQVVANSQMCEEQFGVVGSPLSGEDNAVHDLGTVAADIIGSLS